MVNRIGTKSVALRPSPDPADKAVTVLPADGLDELGFTPENFSQFIEDESDRVAPEITAALGTLAEVMGLDRVTIAILADKSEDVIVAHSWARHPHKNVIDYELLPCHRFGPGKYEHLGRVYELQDYRSPSDELIQNLQAIIDEAFGRIGKITIPVNSSISNGDKS